MVQNSFFTNRWFLMTSWLVVAIVGVVVKYPIDGINNYHIYTGVFKHFIDQASLYGECPELYLDMNHYGIIFGLLIAPFAMLPDFWGLMLWMITGTLFLYFAISRLPIARKWQSIIMLLSLNELYTAVAYQQFNIATVALIMLTFIAIERCRESSAALAIVVGTFVKLYGVVGLAFFFFVKRKVRFILYLLLWSVVLFCLPMLMSSPEYVLSQYTGWFEALQSKNGTNMFAVYQNISILGVVRKISADASYSDLWIMCGGLILFLLGYLRTKQYKNLNFRLMILASVLLFIPLFSSGSEGCSYIMAIVGVGIWWAATPLGRGWVAWTLLALVLFASFAGNLLPRELYVDYFRAYALKALPFMFVWLRASYEILFCNFATDEKTHINSHTGIQREL